MDIAGAINNEADYQKNRNYWKYLKTKLKREGNELVSITNRLKITAPNGKKRSTEIRTLLRQKFQYLHVFQSFSNARTLKFQIKKSAIFKKKIENG